MRVAVPSESAITAVTMEWLWSPLHLPPRIVDSHFTLRLKNPLKAALNKECDLHLQRSAYEEITQ
jgi:hypothetical protein